MILSIIKMCVLAAMLAITAPVFAGETPWVEVGPGSRIRLISSDTVTNGTTLVAIEIDMPQATKTYWRIPGESGIPLLLDFSASTDIASAEILWPYPKRESTGGYLDFVYHGPTVLPVALGVSGDDAIFDANLILGICDEICVPVRTNLTLNINFAKADLSQSLRIRQAVADVPLPWQSGPPPIGEITVDAAKGRIYVAFTPGAVDPASVIIDTGNPTDLFSLPKKSPESGVVMFEMLDAAGFGDADGTQMTVTFLTPDGVFELTRTVRAVADSNGNS